MKKRCRSKIANVFLDTSKKTYSLFLLIIAYLSYVAEIRISIENSFGVYYAGVVDGIVMTISLTILILYVRSFVFKE
jgi:hypothetical protein